MEQYQAVELISRTMIADGLAEAILLKGSLARGQEDSFSNIDMYAIVEEENFERFLNERIRYLTSYMPILYHTFAFYRYPQVICIFENGIHMNLFTTRFQDLSQNDDIVVIYDPKHILASYKKIPLSFSAVEIGELISSFCLNALEFCNAYNRGDLIYSLRLASHMSVDIGTFLRIQFEPEYAKLGLKRYFDHIDDTSKQKFLEIIKKMKIDSVLECAVLMFVLLDSYIIRMPLKIAEYINFDFYHFSKRKIMSIVK